MVVNGYAATLAAFASESANAAAELKKVDLPALGLPTSPITYSQRPPRSLSTTRGPVVDETEAGSASRPRLFSASARAARAASADASAIAALTAASSPSSSSHSHHRWVLPASASSSEESSPSPETRVASTRAVVTPPRAVSVASSSASSSVPSGLLSTGFCDAYARMASSSHSRASLTALNVEGVPIKSRVAAATATSRPSRNADARNGATPIKPRFVRTLGVCVSGYPRGSSSTNAGFEASSLPKISVAQGKENANARGASFPSSPARGPRVRFAIASRISPSKIERSASISSRTSSE
mmetsp:Transcript_2323/g.9109  ORF Transcript_2323/g.9109 Transcript_2323/m.9109 type:complete len:300 (+) Transcript_2323:1271-2170(+)